MLIRVLMFSILLSLVSTLAWASPFDGWSVEEITAHPDFTRDNYSLSSTTNSGDEDAPRVYYWIGYIPVDDQRIYFTSFGEALTCVEWKQTGEWVPEWVVKALDRLVKEGLIKFP